MNAGDGRVFQILQIAESGVALTYSFWNQVGKGTVRNGKDVGVGGFFAIIVELHRGDATVFDAKTTNRGAKLDLASFFFDCQPASVVKLGKRNDGNAQAITRAVGQKGLPEDVDAVTRVGLVELFVESANQDHAPEALDGALGLALAAQPLQHGDGGTFVQIARMTARAQDRQHGAGDRKFVFQCKRSESRKRTGHVEWCGQEAGLHLAAASLRVQKQEAIEEFDFVRGADAPVEIVEVGAAAESYVLAVIDVLTVGQHVGRGAAAEKGTLFEQPDPVTRFSQRDAGCQARQAAADHDHTFQGYSLPS